MIGKYIVQTKEMQLKRVKLGGETENEDVFSYAHEVKQLSGALTGMSCEICSHDCEVKQIPFIVSSVSYHSRKPNCELFDCLYHFHKELKIHHVVNYLSTTEGWNYLHDSYDPDGIRLEMKSFYSKTTNCLWDVKRMKLSRKGNLKGNVIRKLNELCVFCKK